MIPNAATDTLEPLRAHAQEAAARSSAPYSGQPVGVALLLGDGRWVPGVRVESGSFPLTIPALLGAWVAAVGAGRRDVAAAALSRPFARGEWGWLAAALDAEPVTEAESAVAFRRDLPAVGERLEVRLEAPVPADDAEGVRLAREVSGRAFVPHSDFPVGCVLLTEEGALVPGVNVEHADWTRGLCAERSALATAAAYGVGPARRVFLACPREPRATPCGACRQLLAEQAPGAPIVMGRGDAPAETAMPEALLPNGFRGDVLRL